VSYPDGLVRSSKVAFEAPDSPRAPKLSGEVQPLHTSFLISVSISTSAKGDQ
jgi:hypothetical protein